MLLVCRRLSRSQTGVEHLDGQRKRHGKVDVAFWDMKVETFSHKRDSNQKQKGER